MDFKSNEHPEARARKLTQLAKDVASAGDASASAEQALAAAAQSVAARDSAQGFSATAEAAASTVAQGVASTTAAAAAALASRNQSAEFSVLSGVARGLAVQAKIDAEQALTAGQGARDQAIANALAAGVSEQNALGSATAGAAQATIATLRASESEISATSATAQANLARLAANESGTNAAAAALTSTSSAVRATEAGVSASAAMVSQLSAEVANTSSQTAAAASGVSAVLADQNRAAALASSILSASFAATVGLTPNARFDQGVVLWDNNIYAISGTPMPESRFAPSFNGRANVIRTNVGEVLSSTGRAFSLDKTKKITVSGSTWSDSAGVAHYLGLVFFDVNDAYITQRYSSSLYVSTGVGWVEHAAVFNGTIGEDGAQYPATAVKARPFAFVNYHELGLGGNGKQGAIDYLYAEDITQVETALSAASVAQASSATASNAAAAAATSASLSASVGLNALNREPTFASYVTSGPAPLGWINGTGPNNFVSEAGDVTGRAVSRSAAPNESSWAFCNPLFPIEPSQWLVIEAHIKLNSGSLVGAGLLLTNSNTSGQEIGTGHVLRFSDGDNNTGLAVGAGAAGTVYRFSKLIRIDPTLTAAKLGYLYWMNHWTGIGSIADGNNISWRRCSARPATPAEIRDQTVLAPLQIAVATNSTDIMVQALATAAQATQINILSAEAGAQDASITTLQAVSADSASKLATARVRQVVAAGGGAPAVFELFSDTSGSSAQLSAAQIQFGGNTIFYDASDILETTIAGDVINSIAYGAPFGASSNLLQWLGPTGIPVASRTKENAYFFTSSTLPYIGGSQVPGSAYAFVDMTLINTSATYSVTGQVDLVVPAGRAISASGVVFYEPNSAASDRTWVEQIKMTIQNLTDGGAIVDMAGSEVTGSTGRWVSGDLAYETGVASSSGSSVNSTSATKTFRLSLLSRKASGTGTGLHLQNGKLELSAR